MEIHREKVKRVTYFIFLVSKFSVNSDCSHEIEMFAPCKKCLDKRRQHVKKQKHHFGDKGLYNQRYIFSGSHVWLWQRDHKEEAEPWRIAAFKSCCWRRLLRVVWTARRSNQSILKEINPEYSLEGLMLWPPVVKSQHTEKGPDAGTDWGQKKKKVTEGEMVGWQHQLSGHAGVHETCWCPCMLQSMKSERVREELVSDWATTMILLCGCQLIAL